MTSDLPSAALRSRPRLAFRDAAGTHAVELVEPRTAGSAPGCELIVSDRAVSRIHAELAAREDGLWVRDLGSRNGVFIGNVRVREARVPPGGSFRLGATEFKVTYGDPERPAIWNEARFGPLVARSVEMREVFATVASLASDTSSVLILGEPGSGRNTVARALHEASPRADAPFVVVDCAALPEPVAAADILENALSSAVGGTLLLDGPETLPLALQRELVPPLDAKAFRVLAVSAVDPRPLVNTGAFREGLYFRLAGSTVRVPPLRQHLEDVQLLLEHFLGDDAFMLTPSLLDDLARLPWPGNVRELRNYAERLRSSGGVLEEIPYAAEAQDVVDAFADEMGTMETMALAGDAEAPTHDGSLNLPTHFAPWFIGGFKEFREKWIELGEREYLRKLMARTERSSGAASREAGLERTYLYRLLKKHGV